MGNLNLTGKLVHIIEEDGKPVSGFVFVVEHKPPKPEPPTIECEFCDITHKQIGSDK